MCHPLFRGTNKLHSKLIPRYPLVSSAIQIFGQNRNQRRGRVSLILSPDDTRFWNPGPIVSRFVGFR